MILSGTDVQTVVGCSFEDVLDEMAHLIGRGLFEV